MKQRVKRLVAYLTVTLLLCQCFGTDTIMAWAEQITFDVDIDINADSSDDYVYLSGGAKTLTVEEGVTLSGDVDFTSESPSVENSLVNDGTILGNVLIGDSAAKITNNGTISGDISMGDATAEITNNGTISSGSFVLDGSSTIKNIGTIEKITVNGGNLNVAGGNVGLIDIPVDIPVSLFNCTVDTLETYGQVNISGEVIVDKMFVKGSISKYGMADNATLNVKDCIEFHGDISDVNVYVDKTTMISNLSSNDVWVGYNEHRILIEAGKVGTLEDICGCTIHVSASETSHITYTDASDNIYMPTEISETITLTADEGYYFPDDYCETSLTCNGEGTLTAERESETLVTLWYQVDDNDGETVTIEIGDATVKPKEIGEGSISIEDTYYGVAIEATIASDTNAVESATIEYKLKDASDTTYSAEIPKVVGAYTARVTFEETDTHTACVATEDFNIVYLPIPDSAYVLHGEMGENDFYISKVEIVPIDGYSIATEQDGAYQDKLEYEVSQNVIQAFLKKFDDGAKTDVFEIPAFMIDTTPPDINVVDGQVYYGETVTIDVMDDNLSTVTCNGTSVLVKEGKAQLILESTTDMTEYIIVAKDLAGLSTQVDIQIADEWLKTGIIPANRALQLSANKSYQFGSGTWTIDGDTTQYNGGQSFYVPVDGTYIFKAQ